VVPVPAKAARIAGLLLSRQKSTAAPSSRKRQSEPKPAPRPAPSTKEATLAERIRDYAARHPTDTDSIIAAAFRCTVDEVRAALAEGGSPI
jgi:hypothetical protein